MFLHVWDCTWFCFQNYRRYSGFFKLMRLNISFFFLLWKRLKRMNLRVLVGRSIRQCSHRSQKNINILGPQTHTTKVVKLCGCRGYWCFHEIQMLEVESFGLSLPISNTTKNSVDFYHFLEDWFDLKKHYLFSSLRRNMLLGNRK